MRAFHPVLLALGLPILSVAGFKTVAGPSVRVVPVSQNAGPCAPVVGVKTVAGPSGTELSVPEIATPCSTSATDVPEPNFLWVGLGQESRHLEVDADFANKKENVAALLDVVLSNGNDSTNGTIAIDMKEERLRRNILDTLVAPMLQRRKEKLGKFIALLYEAYNDILQECSYESCDKMKCRYRKGADRQDTLLQESCIGARNMARYQALRSDYETVLAEVEDRFARESHVDIGFFAKRIGRPIGSDNVEFEKDPELAGDWSCTGFREGAVGCPTLTVSNVITTMTITVVSTSFYPTGIGSRTNIWPQTWTSTEQMHAEYPLVTGTSETGPDEDQILQDPLPQHMWQG